MKAVAFDLGDTLVEYEGLPTSWEAQYPAALAELARHIGCPLTGQQVQKACGTLRRYNTRLNPRLHEVEFRTILSELLHALGAEFQGDAENSAIAFFSVFRQRLRCFPDTLKRLDSLRLSGVRIGVLTDVPYAMPRRLVLADMDAAGILGLIDEVVTSVDAGVRKPSPDGLALLATRLQVEASEIIFVGNEKKDIDVAVAFGCKAVLLDRKNAAPNWNQHRTISTLSEF